jgi:exonuclease III
MIHKPICFSKPKALVLLSLLLSVSSISTPLTQQPTFGNEISMNSYNPSVNLACINVNSLNIASANKATQLKKLYGILKLKSDIIMLSDTRLSNRNLVSSIDDVTRILRNNPYGSYTSIFNSTKNKRGTGILINNNICFSEVARIADPDENYLLIKLRIDGNIFILGSIYGPNDTNREFFINLECDIVSLGRYPILLGGDWNLTFSPLPVEINPDCMNMQSIPNLTHSLLLRDLCQRLELCDPFRALYPDSRNFSYIPRSAMHNNRSRIDFFIMSDSLLGCCSDCKIADSLQSSLFDHKAVLLQFRHKHHFKIHNPIIYNSTVNDPDCAILIDIAIKESYLIYQDMDRVRKNDLLTLLGTARNCLRTAGPCSNHYSLIVDFQEDDNRVAALAEVNRLCSNPDLIAALNNNLNISDDLFFEMLLNNVRNEFVSYQAFLKKFLRRGCSNLIESINILRKNYDLNFQEIQEKERRLQLLSESEIERILSTHPVFEHLNNEKMSPSFLKLAKSEKNSAKLSGIVNNENIPFQSERARNEYIVQYFENIYKVPENSPNDFSGCIQAFLGPEICNNPIVTSCILNQAEADLLDNNISLQELDESVKEAKIRTACGGDGFSNLFI